MSLLCKVRMLMQSSRLKSNSLGCPLSSPEPYLETELSRAQGGRRLFKCLPSSLRCNYWLFAWIVQLMFLTRSQGSAHGRAVKVDRRTHIHNNNTLLWSARRNLHDQSGRPGDTVSGGQRDGHGWSGGAGWETQRLRERGRKKRDHEKEGWGENEDWEKRNMRAALDGERKTGRAWSE